MLTGFNTNIKYKGEVFHVQTEDSGLRNPVITTLLYRGGVILASKKTSYKELIPEDTRSISTLLREKIKQLMTEQHRSMISDLFSGRFDDIITGQKPTFQEGHSISAEGLGSIQPEKARDSGNGNISLTKESGKSTPDRSLLEESKREDGGISSGPEKQTPSTKSQTMRSLDDILLEHIMKKKKNT
ncbi:MAG: hypothetical protein ACK4TF_04560 [Thermodesulfovibrionales bacterium]